MKKIVLIALLVSLFTACGKSKTGKQIADEICECSKKANGLPTTDTTRSQAQKDCTAKASKAWNEVKDDTEKAAEYNKVIGMCADEQIKKSFGQ
ncbi:MAG: hypothetical protein H7Y01_02765 [Ferruginibacter sp.]|nr:hypothetical protein [Chitinophagaceae bacterium]